MNLRKALMIASIGAIPSFASQTYPDDGVPCSDTSNNAPCYVIIANSDLDNIHYKIETAGTSRVDFKMKSRISKYFYFRGSDAEAKGYLSIMLTAKSTGGNVKIQIPGGSNYSDGSSTPYSDVGLVDP